MSRENVEVVRALYDSFNARDTQRIREIWTGDCEWRPALIGGGVIEGIVYRGHEGIAEFLAVQADTWESVVAEPVSIQEVGESVLVEAGLEAIGRASGIPLRQVTWHVFDLREGKIRSGRVYMTRDEALEAVGLRD